jgi:hypothetical protein
MAFRAFGLFFTVDEGLELVIAFLADVLVNGHIHSDSTSEPPLLKSICGEFANLKVPRGAVSAR